MFCKQKMLFLAVLIAFCFSVLISEGVFAYSASVTASGTINLEVSASGNGTSVVADEVTINSDCPLGYTLSIGGPNDSTLYKDGDKTSISKINASAGDKNNPASIISNKKTWGYATGSNVTINSNFIGLTGTPVELTSSTSASAAAGDKFNVYYGVSIDATTEAGVYTLAESSQGAGDNVITYFLTTDPGCNSSERYVIQYDDNGVNSPTKMTGASQDVKDGDEVMLQPSNFQNRHLFVAGGGPNGEDIYMEMGGFAGWSTVQLDAKSADFKDKFEAAIADGNVFGPMETITIDSNITSKAVTEGDKKVIKMYAVWLYGTPGEEETQPGGEPMANWLGCYRMNIGDVTYLGDRRDHSGYAIAKLADGNCWMIENLRLTNIYGMLYEDDETNLPDGGSFQLAGSQNPNETAWCNESSSGCTEQSMVYAGNVNNIVADMTSTSENIYSYGNYYNWYSATAGTYDGSSDSAVGDICPAGWHLPKGGTSGEFLAKSSSELRSFPNNFIYAGYVDAGNSTPLANRGTGGYYWSSTNGSGFDARAMSLNSSSVNSGSLFGKYDGLAVRCVSDTDYYVISFDGNGGTGEMADQAIWEKYGGPLNKNEFVHPNGLGFAGWNTKADGTGKTYSNEFFVSTGFATVGEPITLYAQWGETIEWALENAGKTRQYGYFAMQDMSNSICENVNVIDEGSQTKLVDRRDGKVYWVAKLADGRCWMTQNLELSVSKNKTYTSDDTNTAYGWKPSASTSWTSDGVAWNSNIDGGNFIQQSAGGFLGNWNAIVDPTQSTTLDNVKRSGNEHYSFGVYYNYSAAIARNDSSTYTLNGEDAADSVCPKGWVLPMGGSYTGTGSYRYLLEQYGLVGDTMTGQKAWESPLYFTLGGEWHGASSDVSSKGYYWTSRVDSEENAYTLEINYDGTVNTNSSSERSIGQSVRCVSW